jgi:hypothetical protein
MPDIDDYGQPNDAPPAPAVAFTTPRSAVEPPEFDDAPPPVAPPPAPRSAKDEIRDLIDKYFSDSPHPALKHEIRAVLLAILEKL